MSIAAAVGQRVHRPAAADASFAVEGQAASAADHLPLAVITSISIGHRQSRRLICTTTTAGVAEDKDAQRGGPRRRVLVVGEVI